MNKNKYLTSLEYDFYTINLGRLKPFTRKNIVEKKIFSNLEKIHPCFSEFSTYDYVLKSKGMDTLAQIVVLDSLFLLEYKKSNKVPYVKVKELKNRKCCLSEKHKSISKILIFSFICILLFVSVLLVNKIITSKKTELENIPQIVEQPQEKRIFDISKFIELCLPVFNEQNIKVSYFEYNGQNIPQITLHTSGIQREVIENYFSNINKELKLGFSSTTYTDMTPSLSFTVNCDKQLVKTASFCDVQSSFIEMRNSVFLINGLPVSEDIESRQFQCIIPYNGLKLFFNKLHNIQNEHRIKFEKLILDYNQEVGNINCVIVLDRLKSDDVIDFTNLLSVFKKPIEKIKKSNTIVVETKSISDDRVLVGKMPSADGSIILYYRTKDGKIVHELE